MTSVALLVAFLLTVPAANWMILHVGDCSSLPCVVPVWPGLSAPSGVLMVGLALVLRDGVHHLLGWKYAALAIVLGAGLSSAFAPGQIALASGFAFLLSEACDLLVYEPLRARGMVLAVVASSIVGAVIDSAVFLYLAFGSLQYLAGQ